jgi:hypothetical protein
MRQYGSSLISYKIDFSLRHEKNSKNDQEKAFLHSILSFFVLMICELCFAKLMRKKTGKNPR